MNDRQGQDHALTPFTTCPEVTSTQRCDVGIYVTYVPLNTDAGLGFVQLTNG